MKVKKSAAIDDKNDDKDNETLVVRKFLLAIGLMFPLVGVSSKGNKLKSDEYVMFLPDIAYQKDDSIFAGIQAWVYEKEHRRGFTRLLALFLGIEMSKLSSGKRRQFYERTQLFRVDSERGKQLTIKDQNNVLFELPITRSNGRTSALIELPLSSQNTPKEISFTLHDSGTPAFADKATTFYVPPNGLSIISDIDDTIKNSSVGATKQLLINTFLEDFTPIEGMSSWYKHLNKDGNTAFHYVSSSPIQLYPVLIDFIKQYGYPIGSMHLREATRWTDIIAGSKVTIQHKTKSIERILNAYPKRKFILIGDSSEKDPMIYANCMRCYPQQIYAIIIRDVNQDKNSDGYETVFSGLDRHSWLVTHSVEEMKHFTDKIIALHHLNLISTALFTRI